MPDEQREAKIDDVCQLYRDAPSLHAAGERVLSTDEMTGVQALERLHPGKPMRPGKVEYREFEYKRHGTLSFIVNFNVATGEVGSPTCGPTRTGDDFVSHIKRTVETEPRVSRWHFVTDNLNTHCSETPTAPKRWFAMWQHSVESMRNWVSPVATAFFNP